LSDFITGFKEYMNRDTAAPERHRKIKRGQESFREYAVLINPSFFKKEREYQDALCNTFQEFYEGKLINPETLEPYDILIINLPPGFGKSYTIGIYHLGIW